MKLFAYDVENSTIIVQVVLYLGTRLKTMSVHDVTNGSTAHEPGGFIQEPAYYAPPLASGAKGGPGTLC